MPAGNAGSDNKGSCSESEHFGSRATFGKRGLKEGTCSGSSSRGSRLKNGLEKKRKPRVPIQVTLAPAHRSAERSYDARRLVMRGKA